jgi:hypothetical protein
MEAQSLLIQICKRGNVRALLHGDTQWQRREGVVNREELNWLLQTITSSENAERFLLAQYKRGRISLQLMNDVAPERDWTTCTTSPLLTRATEYAAMALVFANAW